MLQTLDLMARAALALLLALPVSSGFQFDRLDPEVVATLQHDTSASGSRRRRSRSSSSASTRSSSSRATATRARAASERAPRGARRTPRPLGLATESPRRRFPRSQTPPPHSPREFPGPVILLRTDRTASRTPTSPCFFDLRARPRAPSPREPRSWACSPLLRRTGPSNLGNLRRPRAPPPGRAPRPLLHAMSARRPRDHQRRRGPAPLPIHNRIH